MYITTKIYWSKSQDSICPNCWSHEDHSLLVLTLIDTNTRHNPLHNSYGGLHKSECSQTLQRRYHILNRYISENRSPNLPLNKSSTMYEELRAEDEKRVLEAIRERNPQLRCGSPRVVSGGCAEEMRGHGEGSAQANCRAAAIREFSMGRSGVCAEDSIRDTRLKELSTSLYQDVT